MLQILQLFDGTASPTVERVNWNDVLQMSDHLSKQATIGFYFTCYNFLIPFVISCSQLVLGTTPNSGNAMDWRISKS
jgi:hypothetical protein